MCESNPRTNVNAITYSAAGGTLYPVLDVMHRERHGNGTGLFYFSGMFFRSMMRVPSA